MKHNIKYEQNVLQQKIKDIDQLIDTMSKRKPMLTDAVDYAVYRKREEKIQKFRESRSKPYIGRLEIIENDGKKVPIYIGKTGIGDEDGTEEIVIDWRSEIGKLFTTYSGGKKHIPDFGDLVGKRQIVIDNDQVKRVIDVGKLEVFNDGVTDTSSNPEKQLEVSNDDYLKEILSLTSGQYQLNEIIASLQIEQDEIIRLPLDQSVIVQGVAGSGKSSVALHRISYLLYQYEELLKPEDIIVIAPNKMFISYIKNIDLEIDGIHHDTFVDFALKHLNIKNVRPIHSLLSDQINEEKHEPILNEISKYKSSLNFQKAIRRYIDHIELNYYPKEDIVINSSFIIPEKKILEIYEGYKHLSMNQRRNKTIESIRTIINDKRLQVEKNIEEEFDHAVKLWIDILDEGDPVRRQLFVGLEKSKLRLIEKFKSECDRAIETFIRNWIPLKTTKLYSLFFNDELLLSLDPDCSEEIAKGISFYQTPPYGYDDLAALLYIENRLNGIKESYKLMVIDEAQDLGPFQLYMLNQFTNSMTIMGDITQSIYPSGLKDWKNVDHNVLKLSETKRMSMETSYRSTLDIINVANKVVENSGLDLPKIIPVSRKGSKPIIRRVTSGTELLINITESIKEFESKGYNKIAIIGKDLKQTMKLFDYLQERGIKQLQKIDSDDSTLKQRIIVIPSYIVKGMEFDAVIIPNASDQRFTTSELDARLLYICITRAHHDLHIYYHNTKTKLLEGVSYSDRMYMNAGFEELL